MPPQMMLLECQTVDITPSGPECLKTAAREYRNKKGRDTLSQFTTEVDEFPDKHDPVYREVGTGPFKGKLKSHGQESSHSSASTENNCSTLGPLSHSNSHNTKSCSNENGGSGSGSGSGSSKSQQKSNSESSTSSGSSHHRGGGGGRSHRGGRRFGSGSDSDDDDDGEKKRKPPRKLNCGPKGKVIFEDDDEATDSADEGADDSVMEITGYEGGSRSVAIRPTSGSSSITIESSDGHSGGTSQPLGSPVNMSVGYGAALTIDATISPHVMDKCSPDSESCGAGTPTQDSPRVLVPEGRVSPANQLMSPEIAPVLQVCDNVICVLV